MAASYWRPARTAAPRGARQKSQRRLARGGFHRPCSRTHRRRERPSLSHFHRRCLREPPPGRGPSFSALRTRACRPPWIRVSVDSRRALNRGSHEFRADGVNNRLRKDPINLGHGGRIDTPTTEARDRRELVWMSCAPKRNRPVLPVENPAQGKMDDAPSVIGLREPVEPFDRSEVLLKSRCAELRVYLSQVVPAKLRLRRHPAGEEPPAQRPIGERDNVLVTRIGEDVLFDGAFKQVV